MPQEVPCHQPLALFFGQESKGLSQQVIAQSDYCVRLPQYGFTESYNVAVAAGMLLKHFSQAIRAQHQLWPLHADEKEEIYQTWIINASEHISSLYEHFKKMQQ